MEQEMAVTYHNRRFRAALASHPSGTFSVAVKEETAYPFGPWPVVVSTNRFTTPAKAYRAALGQLVTFLAAPPAAG